MPGVALEMESAEEARAPNFKHTTSRTDDGDGVLRVKRQSSLHISLLAKMDAPPPDGLAEAGPDPLHFSGAPAPALPRCRTATPTAVERAHVRDRGPSQLEADPRPPPRVFELAEPTVEQQQRLPLALQAALDSFFG